MRLLVTGGCGFIGTNFILHLRRTHPEWPVVNLDKLTYAGNRRNLAHLEGQPGYRFVQGDIGDAALLDRLFEEERIEAVIHFAAETHVDRSIDDPAPFLTTNVLGTETLLEAARRHHLARFVHISTDEVYGDLGLDDPAFTESTPLHPSSPYSASKASSDLLVRAWGRTYGLDTVICRCSNNYGPYQFPEKLIPFMILRARAGKSLPVYGDGGNVRDWIFVEDHCLGVELALTKGRPGAVYNFGGASERANLDVVRRLLAITGGNSAIHFVTDRPGHDRRYAMDFGLARRELGFRPTVDFDSGLARTVAWYDAHADWLAEVQSGDSRKFMDNWYQERT